MPLSRRKFMKSAAAAGILAIPAVAAACGGGDDAEPAATPADGSSPVPTPTSVRRGPSSGTMRFAEPFLAASLDADSGSSAAYNLQAVGAAECLMRFNASLQLEPWIAARFDRVDDLTWKITLRDDVTFWDGSPCDAAAVRDSLLRTIEKQPATAGSRRRRRSQPAATNSRSKRRSRSASCLRSSPMPPSPSRKPSRETSSSTPAPSASRPSPPAKP